MRPWLCVGDLASRCLRTLLVTACLVASSVSHAQALVAPASAASPTEPARAESAPGTSQVHEMFDDYGQVEQVAAETAQSVSKKFFAENPSARKYTVNLTSQDHEQNPTRPALTLKTVAVGEREILVELVGLPRTQNDASAVMRRDTLQMKNSKGQVAKLLAFDGVGELRDRRGGSALVVAPGDTLHLLFEKFDDYAAYSLFHVNRDGRDSVYFDPIDPRFRERYDAMHAAANTPLGMKNFLVEFANNDPDKRVLPIFAKFLGEMRKLKTFEGYQGAFQLMGDPKDYEAMRRAAQTDEHKAVIKAIEDEKLAAVRRQEEARLAEQRRQEAVRMEQQRVEAARAAEARCMVTPSCRQEVEARQAACVSTINSCRRQCDSLTSTSGGIMATLMSAVLYRGCAALCKCDSGIGNLFAKMSDLESGNTARAGSASVAPSRSADPRASTSGRDASSATAQSQSHGARATSEALQLRAGTAKATGPDVFVCKIYCKSSGGPSIEREFRALSRRDAATAAGDAADAMCNRAGHGAASSNSLPESQCWKK